MTATNRPEFADELAALARHLTEHPGLPQIYHAMERLDGGLEIRLMSRGQGAHNLAAWAATLSAPITTHAERYKNAHADGHLLSQLGEHVVEVVASLPDDSVPAEDGRHEWTVPQ